MVGNLEGTVGFDEKTVAFKKATDWLKLEKGLDYGTIGTRLGLKRTQMDMIRAFRRRVTNQEIRSFVDAYPDVYRFFYSSDTNIVDDNKAQTLNEPMTTHFYGKQKQEPWPELVETQRKLIARLEAELEEVKGKLKEVEGQNKVLEKIVSQLK